MESLRHWLKPSTTPNGGERAPLIGANPLDVLNHVSGIVLVIAPDLTISWASPSTETACGWTSAELEQLHWHTLVHPADVDRVRELVRAQAPRNASVELRLRGARGNYRWHRASVQRLNETPQAGYVVELIDVNSEVKLRQQRYNTDETLRRLFDDLTESVVEWQPIRESSGRIVDLHLLRCNQAFNDRFGGYSMEGRRASAFFPLAISMIPAMEALTAHGGESLHNIDVGQDVYRLHLSATSHGTVIGVSRRMNPNDSRSDSPSATEQQEHLARVAHTLRTNLSVVQGWTDLLADAEDDPDVRHEAVQRISRNTKTLLASVNELMASAANNGRYALTTSPVELTPLLAAAVEDLRPSYPHISLHLRSADGLAAHTNPSALSTVLQHLLENAARFATSQVIMTATPLGNQIALEVQDDGPGIAADVELFKAFTPNHHGEGNGVGLNVVHKLVEALDGTITATNRSDGPGARFLVTIPANQAELSSR